MGGGEQFPILIRGEGVHVWDTEGKHYLDGLSQLFCVNIGHGRADVGEAGAKQAAEIAYASNWSYSHPRSIELAARVASMAPGDLNRVFFLQLSVVGSTMGTRDELERLATFLEQTGVRPKIDRILPLAQAKDGFAAMIAGDLFGKVVFVP